MAGLIDVDAEKHDTNLLTQACRGLHIGAAGTVKVKTTSGTIHTFYNAYRIIPVPDGIIQVYDTGTDATLITGIV